MQLSNGIEIPKLLFSKGPATSQAPSKREPSKLDPSKRDPSKEPTFLLKELQDVRKTIRDLDQDVFKEYQKDNPESSRPSTQLTHSPLKLDRLNLHKKTQSLSTNSTSQTHRTRGTSQKDDLLSDKTPLITISNFNGMHSKHLRAVSGDKYILNTDRSYKLQSPKKIRELSVGKAVGSIRDFYDQRDVTQALRKMDSFKSRIQFIDQVLDRRKELEELEYQIRFEKMRPMIQKFVKNVNKRRIFRQGLDELKAKGPSVDTLGGASTPRGKLHTRHNTSNMRKVFSRPSILELPIQFKTDVASPRHQKSLFHHAKSATIAPIGNIALVANTDSVAGISSEIRSTELFQMTQKTPQSFIQPHPISTVSTHSLSVLQAITQNKDSEDTPAPKRPRTILLLARRGGISKKDGLMLRKALESYKQNQKNKPKRYYHYKQPTSSSPEAIQALEHDIYHYLARNQKNELTRTIETFRSPHKTINLIEQRAVKNLEDDEWKSKTTHVCNSFNKKLENYTRNHSCRHHKKACGHGTRESKGKGSGPNEKNDELLQRKFMNDDSINSYTESKFDQLYLLGSETSKRIIQLQVARNKEQDKEKMQQLDELLDQNIQKQSGCLGELYRITKKKLYEP